MPLRLVYFCLVVIACLQYLVAAIPSAWPAYNASAPTNSVLSSRELDGRAVKPFYLRIAPLGASITNGYLSSDGNGYRKYLRDELRLEGWPVNMVGSINTGTMNDNDNEGHLGWVTSQVTDSALPNIIPDQPNVVLINVGTNDAASTTEDVSSLYLEYINVSELLFMTFRSDMYYSANRSL